MDLMTLAMAKAISSSSDTKPYDKVVQVSGEAPSIRGASNTRYICGEVTSLTITPPATGIMDVIFTSGSVVTVLTLPQTVILPEWFEIEAGHTYELSIMDGVYGVVTAWET